MIARVAALLALLSLAMPAVAQDGAYGAAIKAQGLAAQAKRAGQTGAFVDFSVKPNGAPPAAMDTGQPVDFHFNASSREPIVSNGKLVISGRPVSGGLADYYQASLGLAVTRVGVQWTQPAGADDGNGNVTYGAWDGIYEGGGTTVPKSWVHMSIVPGTGATGIAIWYIVRGVAGSYNLLAAKTQTFLNPPADGKTIWTSEAVLEAEAGRAYAWLPDGSLMTVTDADIAYVAGVAGVTAPTFADLSAATIFAEHFALTGADMAKFAEFTALYGDTAPTAPKTLSFKGITPLQTMKRFAKLRDSIPASGVAISYSPTTQASLATTTGASNIDGTNGKVTAAAGPNGTVILECSAYYEWTATDVLFWRVAGVAVATSAAKVADVGVAGQKRVVRQTIVVSGLTPGTSYSFTLQQWTVNAGSATVKYGGSGGGMLPPLTMSATPA